MQSEQFLEVPLGNVLLDGSNPRLPRDVMRDDPSQVDLLRFLARNYNLKELARSIADKGFTPRHAEALLVIPDPTRSGTYVTVEGNRRLATLKILTDQHARQVTGTNDQEWADLADAASKHSLSTVPVIVYPSRDALDTYVGFRHITGPKPWRPEAKARFVAHLLRGDETIRGVARHIGSTTPAVRRLAEAYAVHTQAMTIGANVDGIEQGFGVFYNALTVPGIRVFLGLGPQNEIISLPVDPVPTEYLNRLIDLIGLLFGDSEHNLKRVINESRDLSNLGTVLADSTARANLMRDRNLDRAWRIGGGDRQDFIAMLIDLRGRLGEANGQSVVYSNDEEVIQLVAIIYEIAQDMAQRYGIADHEA